MQSVSADLISDAIVSASAKTLAKSILPDSTYDIMSSAAVTIPSMSVMHSYIPWNFLVRRIFLQSVSAASPLVTIVSAS